MSLQNLQVDIAEALLSGEAAPDHAYPTQHLDIYRRRIYQTLLQTLETIYPLTAKLLGKATFTEIAYAYINAYPSCHTMLRHYGEYLSQFIQNNLPPDELTYLLPVTQFEYASHQLEHAATIADFE